MECVGTQESMMQAIRSTRPGGYVSYVGVPHGVELQGEELFFSHVHLHGGSAPVSVKCMKKSSGMSIFAPKRRVGEGRDAERKPTASKKWVGGGRGGEFILINLRLWGDSD